VACAEEGSRGGEQSRGRERTTRGGHPSRRWSGSQERGTAPAAGENRAEQHVPEEEEERGGVRGTYLEISKFQGLLGKARFPIDLEV
jgi:hypothetical protein